MERKEVKKIWMIGAALGVIGASFVLGVVVGYANRPPLDKISNVLRPEEGKPAEVDFSLFWDVWHRVESDYVDKGNLDRQKLVEGAIAGLVRSLGDPYTVFMPKQVTREFQQDIHGSFEGIGAEIGMRKGIITIIAPLKNSPAERAGLRAGDKILKIDDKVTSDLSVDEAVRLIRAAKGTKVKLTIFREGEDAPRAVTVTRDTIVVLNVVTTKKDNGIFVIQLSRFSETSPADFQKAVAEFQSSGSKKLVLDLRNDPGGYLSAAVDIASWFLPSGEVVVQERWSDGHSEEHRSRGYGLLERVPVVVLVNQGSASASEILAGALRDDRGVELVGEKTFGKGSVQELQDLPGGASLKITIAKWFTPSGKSINENGLEPDVKVTVDPNTLPGQDPVLEKAIQLLAK